MLVLSLVLVLVLFLALVPVLLLPPQVPTPPVAGHTQISRLLGRLMAGH